MDKSKPISAMAQGHIYGIAFSQQDMVAFQRDDLHRETTRLLANGLVQNKNYNDVGLLSSQIIRHEQETLDQLQQAKHQAERHYHYDNNYLLTQVDDSRLGKLSYQYDPIGRLIKAQNPYSSESFSFDPAGNLIDPVATQTSQVKNNLITQYQGKHYKYDAQGNVIESTQSGQTLKLTWDNLNRLIQSDHNGQITSYGYDVFGRRLFKKNTTEDSLTLFGWDGDLMIWESQRSNKENYTKHYVYEPDSFVPLLQTGYTRFIELIETPDYRQFQDVPYSIYKDPVWKTDTRKNKAELERVAFYHCDQVGTPQTLSNELGECIWEIKQDTWGTALEIKATEEDNPFGDSNIRFQGQYYDKETGLHYNRYRYYEPYSARYVSKDPIGLFGGLNNSVYVSDPNQWIDPMGLMGDKEKNASDYDRYSKIANAHYAKEKADDAKALAKLKAAREVVKINDARYEQQNRPSTGILGALLPGTMSSFAKNKQDANVLRNRQGMRNVGTVGAAVAASPYALSSPIGGAMAPAETATVYTAATNSVASTMIKGGAVSVALDGSVQAYKSIDCLCNAYSAKQSAGAFVGGVAGGAFAGKMLKTANYLNLRAKDAKVISQVGALNISKNLNNPVGITTWLNSALIGATSGSIAKDVFKSDKKEKK